MTSGYSKEQLATALAGAVGEERANELVDEAMRELGTGSGALSASQAGAILDHVGRVGGLLGAATRLGRSRLGITHTSTEPGPSQTRGTPATEVASLLAASVGEERAVQLVEECCDKLGFDKANLGTDEISTILDELAKSGGVVAAVARFAKARALLSFK